MTLVHPRSEWATRGWVTPPGTVPAAQRRTLVVHWFGGPPRVDRGPGLPREIDAIHRGKGWVGVGYNWVVGQDGEVWEGRGWDLVGAHATGHNTTGIGVLVAVGQGGPGPTREALAAVRALADEADRRSGRRLRRCGHRDLMATECPGDVLSAWIHAGMPIKEDDVAITDADVAMIWRAKWPDGDRRVSAETRLAVAAQATAKVDALTAKVDALAGQVELLLSRVPE